MGHLIRGCGGGITTCHHYVEASKCPICRAERKAEQDRREEEYAVSSEKERRAVLARGVTPLDQFSFVKAYNYETDDFSTITVGEFEEEAGPCVVDHKGLIRHPDGALVGGGDDEPVA